MYENICIIIPSLNPDDKFIRVLDGLKEEGFSSFVLVDDGSDEMHQQPFLYAKNIPGSVVLKHDVNMGKGQAIKDAFNYIAEKMPETEYAITIDGDGQHTPKDTARLAEALMQRENDIVFGCRDFDSPNVPTHNRLGNIITAGVFKIFFGMNISDAQTGLRGFPRKYLLPLANDVEGTRYEYESNVLIYISENKIPFSEIKIETVYIDDNESSHFRPIADSFRIYKPILLKSTSLKYISSSVFCTIIDEVLFTILNFLFSGISILPLETLLTTGLARLCSSVCNYNINKDKVFHSDASVKSSAPKYFAMVAVQYGVSWLLCTLAFSLITETGLIRTLVKLLIDLFLFFVNYFIQKKWVFK